MVSRVAVVGYAVMVWFLASCNFGSLGGQASPAPETPKPVQQTPTPTPARATASPTVFVSPSPSGRPPTITVAEPSPNAEVRTPVRVRGAAVVFEGNVQIVVRNARREEVGKGFTTATVGAPDRGDYTTTVAFTLTGARQNGAIEVFSLSPRDGSVENLVSVPVVLLPN